MNTHANSSTYNMKSLFSDLGFLAVIFFCGIKVFVIPTAGVYMLAFLLLAETWTDASVIPYIQSFLTVAPIVWVVGTIWLFNKFYHAKNEHGN